MTQSVAAAIVEAIEDAPDDQSRTLAIRIAAEITAEALRAYAIDKLERDIHEVRRRRTRMAERDSRLAGRMRTPMSELRSRAADLLAEYTEQIQVDWTSELRASIFALGDGTSVAWGDATEQQHRQRISMLEKNVRGNLDAIRRHEAAIRMLHEVRVSTLNEIVDKLADAA